MCTGSFYVLVHTLDSKKISTTCSFVLKTALNINSHNAHQVCMEVRTSTTTGKPKNEIPIYCGNVAPQRLMNKASADTQILRLS